MSWTRRSGLATAATSTFGACAAVSKDSGDHIIDTAAGQRLTPCDVAHRLRAADIALLGELQDNPHSHDRRAAPLTALGTSAAVVAEHLPRSAVLSLPAGATGDVLRQVLEADGFDVKGWRWPLHEPMFAAIARVGIPRRAGNLEREAARRLARGGADALPHNPAAWVAAAPLIGTACRAGARPDAGPPRTPERQPHARDGGRAARPRCRLGQRLPQAPGLTVGPLLPPRARTPARRSPHPARPALPAPDTRRTIHGQETHDATPSACRTD